MRKPIIVITGPTACGKTALSVRVAKALDGEIICTDSMQIYRGMDIGTAKVRPEEMEGIPHHLVDFVPPESAYSVAEFQRDARAVIEEIYARGKVSILVGGTGLYINAVLYPMTFKEYDPSIRAEIEEEFRIYGREYMYEKLLALAPEMAAKLSVNDVKRVTRALELVAAGESHNREDIDKEPLYPHLLFVLHDNRAKLYERINERVDVMMKEGLLAEVKGLLDAGVPADAQSFQAIAYKELAAYFAGKYTLEEAVELIKKRSRNYAKRQLTWFRGCHNARWILRGEDNLEEILRTWENI